MFIESAYADNIVDNNLTGGVGFGSLWVFVFIFIIMYFLMIRPQQQQQKKHQEKLNSIKNGDKVVTAGGILAKVKRVDNTNDELLVEISDNVEIKILKSTISDVIIKN